MPQPLQISDEFFKLIIRAFLTEIKKIPDVQNNQLLMILISILESLIK